MGIMRGKPYQNHNRNSQAYGKWFMRMLTYSTYDINEVSSHIASDSKLERTTVATTNSAVNRQIVELLCNGHPIRIPHLGMLKLGVRSKGTETVSDYNAGSDIQDVHLLLVPDKEIKAELRNLKFEKYYIDEKPVTP